MWQLGCVLVCEETLRAMSVGNFKAGQQADNLLPAWHETLTIATSKGFVPLGSSKNNGHTECLFTRVAGACQFR